LAARPEPGWLWVEGDSAKIRWREFAETFRQFDFDRKALAGRDGFVRVAENEANSARLASLVAMAPLPK
jgi:hypothetical protein